MDGTKFCEAENHALENFKKYLRINTSHPRPDYAAADEFYLMLSKEVGLDFKSVEMVKGKPFAILSWIGSEPSWSSVMLYCHTDVVPVFPENWSFDPFGAVQDVHGNIYARGAQDMKSVGIQYVEAIRRLKAGGERLRRTVHVVFGPDEEIGSHDGMEKFVQHQCFKDLNVGFAMDEGIASPSREFKLFYGQRSCWWFSVTFQGKPGHGSSFIEDTAVCKLNKLISRSLEFRAREEQRLNNDPSLRLGDVTTLNINMLKGGVQYNVVPNEMTAYFDVRIANDVNLVEFEDMLHQWCREAGSDYSILYEHKNNAPESSCVDDTSPWWRMFNGALKDLGISVSREIFPAGTDGRFVQALGIPVYGFSPMNSTPILLHDHNEYLNEVVFLRGIEIYESLISALSNVAV